MKVKESNLIACRKCGSKVVKKKTKKGTVVLVDVYQDCTGLNAVVKNGSVVGHRC